MSTNHTPGPWRYSHDGHGGMRIESIQWQIGYASSAGGKQEANARLMAAAPKLLEALRLLHNNIAEYQRINNLGGYDNHDMRMARAAIALATGEPQ